ncbi:probable tRNA (uracil-O(2)-)-methyltransferase [Copidosoma floridanum]|uniref:probable tRNA (uracil-O(2)-)-methyltransferase n=1 Tax=Copidosoma floridanum TaxID=29053 RepID=UPI0006C96D4E|nr:probable tRNA (uracil-O(2)-)-methyltransferase [Copidosoma floridanum]
MEEFHTVVTKECGAGAENFWKAIGIWLKSPHLINRRILASTQLEFYKLEHVDRTEVFKWFLSILEEFFVEENVEKRIVDSLKRLNNEKISVNVCDDFEDLTLSKIREKAMCLRLAKLLPRHTNKFNQTLEICLIDVESGAVSYAHHNYSNAEEKKSLGFTHPYQIKYESNNVSIGVKNFNQWNESENLLWLKTFLFPKLFKWIENEDPNKSLVCGSLKLVSSEKYTNLYNNLKRKYGTEMVKIWPENTDPLKFVYEDVAIATYLLLLWEIERERLGIHEKQSFLDLGCGNGLLVHILNSEGYPGLGIDLRKRKIWDLYPETTKLEVRTVIPSSKSLFPDTNWLIGNHSDELTPWIPVIAARSSYKCRFFLLPCCAYEFNGRKYQRESSSSSQYTDYMQYIKDVSEKCGFKTDIDKLRIPSTKRICLIGTDRSYLEVESEIQDLKIQEMINTRCNGSQISDAWSSEFKPRELVEKVRNCTQIDKGLISNIIDIVVSLLLRKVLMIDLSGGKTWNAGGEVELRDVATALDSDCLKKLKTECGGLQTLLKNNGHIFKIESGKVRFRVPGKDRVGRNKKLRNSSVSRKVKACWFYTNHPDGCTLTDIECDFKHC